MRIYTKPAGGQTGVVTSNLSTFTPPTQEWPPPFASLSPEARGRLALLAARTGLPVLTILEILARTATPQLILVSSQLTLDLINRSRRLGGKPAPLAFIVADDSKSEG